MPIYVCSLKTDQPQLIPPGSEYTLVRFPFGKSEPYDAWTMHQMAQPDSYKIAAEDDDRCGLIWPCADGWGSLTGMVYWESGRYTEVRDRFVRDPLNLSTGYDSTATEDHAATPGAQFIHKAHELFVHPETPLGMLVRHNSPVAETLTLAEFKLAVHTDVAYPTAPAPTPETPTQPAPSA